MSDSSNAGLPAMQTPTRTEADVSPYLQLRLRSIEEVLAEREKKNAQPKE